MTIVLGSAPEKLVVLLVKDSDFFSTLRSAEGEWPATAVIELRIADTTWTAILDGEDAIFNEDKVDVNQLIASKPRIARLYYTDGDADICWGIGFVEANG